jgi:hypothetical protein
MLEKEYVIYFLLKDMIAPKGIPARVSKVYGERTIKKTQVFDWLRKTHRGQENLSDKQRRTEIGLDMILAHRSEMTPHTTARKLTYGRAYNWICAYKCGSLYNLTRDKCGNILTEKKGKERGDNDSRK